MKKVAIIGLGFMGKMHFRCYKAMADVQIVAVCDINPKVFTDTGGTAGNITGADEPLDFTGIKTYTDFDKMLAESALDAISITLPTYLHAEYTIKALEAGLDVLCEKPMALNCGECEKMISAAKKSGKILQIGHCIRFWPEYVKTKEIIDSGEYGKVLVASFRRLSLPPIWGWNNWLMDGVRSGGACLDLHIHDTDYVSYVFGTPKAIRSQGVIGPSGDYDYMATSYIYDDAKVITSEGGWILSDSFGFEMSFNVILEKATISYDCTRSPAFKVCPAGEKQFSPHVLAGDGYSREIAHFIGRISGQNLPEITTPQQSLLSVKLIEIEKDSGKSGTEIKVK